jgi:hypothetical protein
MKTLMVSFQPKWARMILSGEKKYEFRQGNFVNAKTGDKFLILESLGKKVKKLRNHHIDCASCNMLGGSQCDECKYYIDYEGTGKVIGEFIVGEVLPFIGINNTKKNGELVMYQSSNAYFNLPRKDMKKIGWNEAKPQPLAFEITQLKVYDTPRDKSEFIIESKYKLTEKELEKDNEFVCNYCSGTDYGTEEVPHVTQMSSGCEGSWCKEAFERYITDECMVERSPQSFMYVIDTKTVI